MKVKRRHIIGLSLAIIGCIGILTAVFNRNHSCLDSESFRLPPNVNQVEKHTLELTRSCTLWIKFNVRPSELNTLISTTLIEHELSSTEMPTTIGGIAFLQQETGWDLNSMNSFLAGETTGTGARYLDEQFVIVDTSYSAQYTVYIVTKRTGFRNLSFALETF